MVSMAAPPCRSLREIDVVGGTFLKCEGTLPVFVNVKWPICEPLAGY